MLFSALGADDVRSKVKAIENPTLVIAGAKGTIKHSLAIIHGALDEVKGVEIQDFLFGDAFRLLRGNAEKIS
jgi:hypothetical protein